MTERTRRARRPGTGRPSSGPPRLPKLLRAVSVGCVILAAPLVACSGDGAAGAPRVGDAAPSYTARTLDGEAAAVGEPDGAPVLLNFWATWCTPCRTETPFLQRIHERYGSRGLRVIGVSMDSPGSVADIRAFVEEMDVTYRILHDPRQQGMDRFRLLGLPATFVLDRDGRIRFARIGPVSEEDEDFRAVLEQVVS